MRTHYPAALKRFASRSRGMADFAGSLSENDGLSFGTILVMTRPWLAIAGAVLMTGTPCPSHLVAQAEGPYARIAIFHPRDGHALEFEAGYMRHLAWHQQAKDTWVWYGWNVTFGERQRWFIYASFGHSATSLDTPVAPADDERDNVLFLTRLSDE